MLFLKGQILYCTVKFSLRCAVNMSVCKFLPALHNLGLIEHFISFQLLVDLCFWWHPSGEFDKTRSLPPEPDGQGSPGLSRVLPVNDLNESLCSLLPEGETCFLPSPHPFIRAFAIKKSSVCALFNSSDRSFSHQLMSLELELETTQVGKGEKGVSSEPPLSALRSVRSEATTGPLSSP